MVRYTRWMLGTIAALAAILVLAPAADAATATKHHLKTYKAEKHLTISEGDTVQTTLSCDTGDIATDGMWRIDHVAQFNPQLADPDELPWDETAIVVSQSQSIALRTYQFTLTNTTSEDAQVKLFIVCLDGKTAPDTHQHTVFTTSAPFQSAGPFGESEYTYTTPSCASGEVFISPGFVVSGGSAEPFSSYPESNLRQWSFGFWVTSPGTTVTVGGRCLSLTTNPTSGHRHKLYASLRTSPVEHFDKGNGITEHQISCADDAKGLVGGFALWHPSFHWDFHAWHWLGMDPRPKTRAYRTLGTGSSGGYYLVCFKDRTSRPLT